MNEYNCPAGIKKCAFTILNQIILIIQTHPNMKITIKAGDQHELVLPGKSTAGYQWIVKKSNQKIITLEKTIHTENTRSPLVGKSADEKFILKGVNKGNCELILQQKRSWENKGKPVDERKYKIIVE